MHCFYSRLDRSTVVAGAYRYVGVCMRSAHCDDLIWDWYTINIYSLITLVDFCCLVLL